MRAATLIRPIPAAARSAGPAVRADQDTRATQAPQATRSSGLIHTLILAAVWLAFALSAIVFTEPAPVDVMFMGLIVLLPAAGLITITRGLAGYLALWSIAAAGGFLAATASRDLAASTIFTVVSLYLYIASFILAAFVAKSPVRHMEVMLSGWTFATVLASTCALIGYFQLIPGAFELFTKFSRASGTFKDPNVFGPFLVAPFLYALHLVLHRPWQRALIPLAIAALLAMATLLSFSRGAWANLILALAVYGALAYVLAHNQAQRAKIVGIVSAGAVLVALVTLVALQNDKIASFLQDRASLTQSYDVGPAGRFGGQEKATRLLLDNPLGIGAGQFAQRHHHEEVHNVYLSMMLNAGWLGGLTYAMMVILTLAVGANHLTQPNAARPLFLIAYAAFVATALEGIIIDSDHWRSFYVLMAMVWGLAASPSHASEP